jgi:hypothetical protein
MSLGLALIAAAQATAAPAPAPASAPAPRVERLCLLAGPSRSLAAVRVVPEGEGYAVKPVPGQVWPFAAQSVALAGNAGHNFARHNFEGRDEAGNLFASYELHFARTGGVTLEVSRGVSRFEGLPVLGGSCAETGSAAARLYLRQANDTAAAPKPAAGAFSSGRIRAGRDCQVVSSAGWVSRFNVEYRDDNSVVIRPADRHLWRASQVRAVRAGMPPPPDPKWIRVVFYFPASSAAEMPEAINSFWVHATPDGSQSSARASFFGYDPEGPVSTEDVTGVCADFTSEGAER